MKLEKPKKEEVKILVVEDETIVALDIKNTLEKYGYNVAGIATTSQEAISLVKSSKPNFILMDIMIKGKKDGIETASEINEFADIPIVFLTAYSDDSTLERAKLVEPYGYLIKPFDNRELFTTIEMSLYKHSMEVSLRESEENLAITLNSIGDAVISTDEKGMIVKMNPVAELLTGWKYEEAKGLHLEKIFYLIDATTRKPIPNPVQKVIESGKVIGLSNHTLLIAKDGTERNISDSAAPIKDKSGNIRGVVLVFSDVTEAYNARKKLKDSEEKFRLLVTQMHQGLAVHEAIYDNNGNFVDYRFIEINESFEKLTGLKREKIIGKTVLEVLPNTESSWIEKYGYVVKTGNPIVYESYSKELGRYYEVVAYRNRPDQFAVIMTDITERKKSDEKIHLMAELLDLSPASVIVHDKEGKVLFANKTTFEMHGYSEEEFLKLTLPEIDTPESAKLIKERIELINKQGQLSFEVSHRRKDGSTFPLIVNSKITKWNNQEVLLSISTDLSERKLYEEALKLSENKFNTAFHATPLAMSIQDNNDIFIDINDAFVKLTGYSRNEIIGKTGAELNLWADLQQRKYVNEVFKKYNSIKDFEFKFRKKDGSTGFGILSAEVVVINGENAALTTVLDITERKLAEERIQESEKKFRTLFNSMPNGYYRTTPDGYFVDANPAFIKMLGYESLEELKNLYIPRDLFVKEEERKKILSNNPEFVSNVVTYRLKKKDGTIIWVEDNARYIKDENGKVIFNEGICKDITDRKKAEDALRESEQLFNTLAQVSPVGIFRTDPNGNTTYVNPKWVRLSGLPADKAMGDGWLQAVHPEDREKIKSGWNFATKNKDVSVAEYRFLRPDGNVIWVIGQAIPEFDAFNNVVGYVGTITDITERKTSEDALKESEERLRILAEKTGTIVYDLNLLSNTVHREGAIEDVLGYSKEEFRKIKADEFYNLFDNDEIEQIKALTDKAIKSGGNYTHYYKLRHKKGHYIYIEDNGIVLKDNNGISYRMLGSLKDITTKKMAEDNLRKSEERFRILVEKTGTIVYDRDLINKHVHREGAIEEVLGYTKEELNSFDKEQLEQLIDEKDKNQYFSDIKKTVNKPGSYSLNYKLKHKNGSFIYIEDNGIVLADESGKPVRALGSMRDVTLKKLAEDELRKLSHAVEQSQVSIVITNKDGIIEYVNPKFCEVSGYSYDEAIGKKSNLLKSGEWSSEAYKGLWDDLLSGRSWTGIFHNKKKNGELFWESVHISPVKDFNGEITNFIAVKEDITEKVKTEEQLTRYREHLEEMVEERTAQLNSQNEFLRSLIDTIPNPIFVKDNEGRYTDVNPAFEKFYGMKKEDLLGKTLEFVLTGEAKKIAMETDEQLLKGKGIVSYETYFTDKNGKNIAVLVYKASFGTLANKPEGIVGIFFDISQRKEMEEKTLAALNKEKELNEMKTNFISMASHEFRTPLTTILASADLVEMYYKKWPEDKVLNHIKKIQDSVNYMTTLLDDVLLLSRADRGKIKFNPSKVNLKELCSQILNEIHFQTVPGHNLIFDYKLKEEVLTVDSKLLTQILNNLLSNAVKFSPEGGDILLEVTKKNNKIQFIVKDNGLGIDQNDLKKIFEPFYRGKNVADINGSGLGMSIVQNAIELHGGEISIESELKKGTKITFTIQTG